MRRTLRALVVGSLVFALPRGADAQPAVAPRGTDPQAAQPKLTKPPRVLQFIEAEYPAEEKARGTSATVVLRLAISSAGGVEEATVVESAGAAFDAAAIAAMKATRFEPAEIDGKPAPIKILYRYAFTLKEEAKATGVFSGVVRDRTTQKPLEGVEVTLESGQTATTDREGRFSIADVAAGKHAVTLTGEKLTGLRTEETVEAGKRLDASYDVVVPSTTTVGEGDDLEIVVTAPAIEKHVASTEVLAAQGRKLPGTQGDVLKVVESMPGVARAQVGSGQLVVWGAAPEETRVYIDGVRVPRLYHGGGLRSVVGSDFVDAVELAPAGYGATYGRGLGGLVTVRTRSENDRRFRATAAVDLLDAGAAVRAPIGEKWSVAVAGRKSHLHTALGPFTDGSSESFFPIPRYEDAQARIGYAVSKDERVDVTVLHSGDRVTRSASAQDPLLANRQERTLSFQRIYARYERDVEGGAISVVPWFGLDARRDEDRFGGVPATLSSNTTLYGLRTSYRGGLGRYASISVGLDAEVAASELARSGSVTTPPREGDARVFGQLPADRVNGDAWKATTVGLAPYAEVDLSFLGGSVHVVPGLRFDPYFASVSRKTPAEGETPRIGSFRQDAAVEPRLSARWQVAPRLSVRGAVGKYRQPASADDLSAVFGNPVLPAASAEHALLGTSVRVLRTTTLETTSFMTWRSDLAVRNPSSAPLLAEALVPIGTGRTYGVQSVLRHDLSHGLTGWLSYAVVRSERQDGPTARLRLSDFDQSHVLTAVGSWDLGKGFEVGARVRWTTGMPRTPVISATYDARRDAFQPRFGERNTDRLPSFFQIDLRVAKRVRLPYGELEAYLEVQNVLNRQNPEEVVYSSTYRDRGYITGLPILPIAGLRWTL